MFWSKKEKKDQLPDLPPLNDSYKSNLTLPNSLKKEDYEDDFDIKEQELKEIPSPKYKPKGAREIIEELENSEDNNEDHELPSFPNSPKNVGFVQAAIKSAVEKPETKDNKEKKFVSVELDEWKPTISPPPSKFEDIVGSPIRSLKTQELSSETKVKKNNDVFIRIDRFHSARKTLEEAKNKIDSIDELLRKIREVKLREEQELSSWEKEIQEVKSKIEEINQEIFDKID